ncbi:MAG: L-2-amino-thiazoline-4-carboxylic acid hydrolase [Promethearchaeota archaeon]|jgi:hypothetical protein
MIGEVEHSTATKIYALYGALFKEIIQELGEAKALALHKNAHEYIGLKTGKQIREQMGDIEYDLETLTRVLQKGNQSIGIDCQMIKSANSLLLRNLRCPMYDGYRLGGLDDKLAKSLCVVGAPAKLWTTLKQLNPGVVYKLNHYRDTPNERCEEEVKLL